MPYYLKSHIQICTGEKPFACEICSQSFVRNSDLERYIKSHSRSIVNHPCDECTESFSSKTNLLAHKRTAYQHTLKRKIPLAMRSPLKDRATPIACMHLIIHCQLLILKLKNPMTLI